MLQFFLFWATFFYVSWPVEGQQNRATVWQVQGPAFNQSPAFIIARMQQPQAAAF